MKLAAAAVLSVSMFASAALAQATDTAPPTPPAGMGHQGPGMHHGFPGAGRPMAMPMRVAPVTNAPFSAKYTFESVQQAPGPDGVMQKYSATETVYRDSLGRTREDVTLPNPPPRPLKQSAEGTPVPPSKAATAPRTFTVITDPVANTVTRLMPDRKVAFVETVPAEYFKRAVARETKAASGEEVPHDERSTATELGSKTFAGVVASGKRMTLTVPSHRGETSATAPADGTGVSGGTTGASGETTAAATRTLTHETWFSPDLKLEVSSTETGGRGTRSNVLTSLTKGEPDAALFKVPGGYTVTSAPPRMPGGMHHGGRGPEDAGAAPAPPAM